jgi:hypothetical protein
LAFGEFSLLKTHFWPFTHFLRKFLPGVAKNFGNLERPADRPSRGDSVKGLLIRFAVEGDKSTDALA